MTALTWWSVLAVLVCLSPVTRAGAWYHDDADAGDVHGVPELVYAANTTQQWTSTYARGVTEQPVRLPMWFPRDMAFRLVLVPHSNDDCHTDVSVKYRASMIDGSSSNETQMLSRLCEVPLDIRHPVLVNLTLEINNRGARALPLTFSLRYADGHLAQYGFLPTPATGDVPSAATAPIANLMLEDLLTHERISVAWNTALGTADYMAHGHQEWQRGGSVNKRFLLKSAAADADDKSCAGTPLHHVERMVPWVYPTSNATFHGNVAEPVPASESPRLPCNLWTETINGTDWAWCYVGSMVFNVQQRVGNHTRRWWRVDNVKEESKEAAVAPDPVCHDLQCGHWGVPTGQEANKCQCFAPHVHGDKCNPAPRSCPCASAQHGSCHLSPIWATSLLDVVECTCKPGYIGHACDMPQCVGPEERRLMPRNHICTSSSADVDDARPHMACQEGWSGAKCDKSACGQACGIGEVCDASGKCQCRPLYTRQGGRCVAPRDLWSVEARESSPLVTWSNATGTQAVTMLARVPPSIGRVQFKGTSALSWLSNSAYLCMAWDRLPDPALGDCFGAYQDVMIDLMDASNTDVHNVGDNTELYITMMPRLPVKDPIVYSVRAFIELAPLVPPSMPLVVYAIGAVAALGGGLIVWTSWRRHQRGDALPAYEEYEKLSDDQPE